MAEHWAENATDCVADGFPVVKSCSDFYLWNAKTQLTTWNPTLSNATVHNNKSLLEKKCYVISVGIDVVRSFLVVQLIMHQNIGLD